MSLELVVVKAIWVMLPAYFLNSVAVLVGGGRPIDGGRTWRGNRILGDGKTWRGGIGGFLAGMLLAIVLNEINGSLSAPLPVFPDQVIVSLPAGAMLGDTAGSFVKRRTGRIRGAPFPGVDQLSFVIGAFVLTWIVVPKWFSSTFTLPVFVTAIVLTLILHLGTNAVAYFLGLKNEPW